MYRSLLTKRTTKGTSVLHTCIHDTLLPKQRSNDAQVHGTWWNCRKDRKGQEERIRGRALGNTAKLGRPWRRCKQQPTSGRTKGARFCKLEPRGDRSVAEKHASCCFQLRLHSLCSRCCLASLVVLWSPWSPWEARMHLCCRKWRDACRRGSQGTPSSCPELRLTVQKGGKSETVSVCVVCLTLPKAVLRFTGFGHPV